MPKRNNPFGDSSPLQFKSHIRPKEVDMGVAESENMKKVYEKTMCMLYEGAKKSSPLKSESSEVNIACSLKPLPGQLLLSNHGLLRDDQAVPMEDASSQASDTSVGNTNNNYLTVPHGQLQIDAQGHLCSGIKVSSLDTPTVRNCHTCRRQVDSKFTFCSFCENSLCAGCLRSCNTCQNKFCHLCSRSNYDDSSERIFCLQCYPQR